jgi:hypothetical protein
MEPRHVHDAPITRDFGPKPADLITRRGQLRASFPSAPLAMVELAARFLTSPGATSDALLLLSEAMHEAARATLANHQLRATQGLANHLRDEAPRFAGRALV